MARPLLDAVLMAKLREADTLDWSRAVVDSSAVRAVLGGQNGVEADGSTEVGESTSCRDGGIRDPLAVILTGANTHDVTQGIPPVEALPSV